MPHPLLLPHRNVCSLSAVVSKGGSLEPHSRAPPSTYQVSKSRLRPGNLGFKPPRGSGARSHWGVPGPVSGCYLRLCLLPSAKGLGRNRGVLGLAADIPLLGLKGHQRLLPASPPPQGWSPAAPPAHLQLYRWLGRAWKRSHRSNTLKKVLPPGSSLASRRKPSQPPPWECPKHGIALVIP